MTVLDVGCGPGFFTRVLADLVGPTGQVIAADLQQEMLTMTGSRMTRKGVSDRVLLHKTSAESLQLQMSETVDFAIAFHVVHEVPSPYTLFSEVFDCSKPGGLFLVSEPNGHVNRTEFDQEMKDALAAGFIIAREQHSRWEHQVILQKV